MRLYPTICLFLGLLLSAAGANAAPQDSNLSSIENAKPASLATLTIAELEKRVAEGDARAMAELGARLGRGDGVKQDVPAAIAMLTRAAEKNDPDALYFLGTAYANGAGVGQDPARAQELYRQAAALGHAESQFLVGVNLSTGSNPDWKAAIPYFWRAADQGFARAEFMMGYAYHLGHGVDKNPETAAYWYRRTNSRKPNPRAQINLRRLIDAGLIQWQPGDPGRPERAKPMSVPLKGSPKPGAQQPEPPRPPVPTVSNYKPIVIDGITFTAEATGSGVSGFAESQKNATCEVTIAFTYFDLSVGSRESGTTLCRATITPGKTTFCNFSHHLVAETKIQEPVAAKCK